jgi:hypothetical protein
MISTLADAATLKRNLAEFDAATDKIAAERKQMNFDDDDEFASKLKAEVKKLLPHSPQHKTAAASSSDDETFAAKLTRFAKEKAKLRKL